MHNEDSPAADNGMISVEVALDEAQKKEESVRDASKVLDAEVHRYVYGIP